MNEKISEILNGFKIFDGIYKRELVDAAIELKDEITPYLIKILENVLSDPDKYLENDDLYDHIYSIMLLGHFRESKAHKIIIDLLCQHGDIFEELFNYSVNFHVILLRTCDGSMDKIKSLALNSEANDYVRIYALHAMLFAVVEGFIKREEVLPIYGSLFTGKEADKYSDFWGLLADLVCDLYPEELMDIIKKAYNDGLIEPGLISFDQFEKALNDGKEKCLSKVKMDLEQSSLDNLHYHMSMWINFQE